MVYFTTEAALDVRHMMIIHSPAMKEKQLLSEYTICKVNEST
jgi:hypothetical protein